jgi:preprotein translocase subunit SecA
MLNPFRVIFGTKHERDIKKMLPAITAITNLEPKMKELSDEQLQAQTVKFREMLKTGATLENIMVEAFATVREASVRVLKMRPYDVQLIGGIVLFKGKIAEMKTGEGKTLCATLPLYLHGLTQKGAHLITVNDYLASRDAEEMGVLFNWLGISVGTIVADMDDEDRKAAYQQDITYGTNNEFAFDYLRDNMKFDLEDYVQRGHNYCIVDEVDSILIDEARTPLLISGPSEGDTKIYGVANKIVTQLEKGKDFTVDEKTRGAVFTDEGIEKVQKMIGTENLFDIKHSELLHLLNQCLKAHHLFTKDVDYVVKDEKIIIVDEFTGRLKEGSRWSDGLHGAIEAKEEIIVKQENQTLASITFQNYFRLYTTLAGMTGTADTEAEEFRKIYTLDVTVVPTNVPVVRIDDADVIYKSNTGKMKAICTLIKELYEKGQPILVGTISIEHSEHISNELKKHKIPHEVLNAKQHEREAQIIANAGLEKSITIATNMAGRGTDIKLCDKAKEVGGLFILGTERHESRRIDNQLRGRSGRQGDPGQSKFFLSLEDDLMRIFGSDRIKKFMNTLGMEEDEPIEHKMITNAIAKAQKKVESHNFEIRKHLLEYDNVMNEQRRVIYHIRKEILSNEGNMEFVEEMLEDVTSSVVAQYTPQRKVSLEAWPWEDMNKSFQTLFNTSIGINAADCQQKYDGDTDAYLFTEAREILRTKFSKYEDDQIKAALREVLLSIFDQFWKDHLRSMDHLKEGINLRAYAQKDPLTEYKRESFSLFEEMRVQIKRSVTETIYNIELYSAEEIEEIKRKQDEELKAQLEQHKRRQEAEEGQANKAPIRRGESKVGRNDPCPCGSGKKFKHCHGP